MTEKNVGSCTSVDVGAINATIVIAVESPASPPTTPTVSFVTATAANEKPSAVAACASSVSSVGATSARRPFRVSRTWIRNEAPSGSAMTGATIANGSVAWP